jgi:hypothetical protein
LRRVLRTGPGLGDWSLRAAQRLDLALTLFDLALMLTHLGA